jgi:hypothetical protein
VYYIWNNVTDAHDFVVSRAIVELNDWRVVRLVRADAMEQHVGNLFIWMKPTDGRVKCNIEAFFSSNNNIVGISFFICWDGLSAYVFAKYDQFSPIYDHRLNLGRVELVVVFSILIRLNLERSLHIVEDFSHLLMLILVFFFCFWIG